MRSRRARESAAAAHPMRDEAEMAFEELLEAVVPGAEALERILQDRRDLLLGDGEDPRHQQVGPVAGVGGDLLAREVGFGDDPARVVQQAVVRCV